MAEVQRVVCTPMPQDKHIAFASIPCGDAQHLASLAYHMRQKCGGLTFVFPRLTCPTHFRPLSLPTHLDSLCLTSDPLPTHLDSRSYRHVLTMMADMIVFIIHMRMAIHIWRCLLDSPEECAACNCDLESDFVECSECHRQLCQDCSCSRCASCTPRTDRWNSIVRLSVSTHLLTYFCLPSDST